MKGIDGKLERRTLQPARVATRVEVDIHVLDLLATVKAYPGNHAALQYSFHWPLS
jgi:hypothetical protein